MRLFQKLICTFKGHYPLGHIDVDPVPKPKSRPVSIPLATNGFTISNEVVAASHGVSGISDPYFYPTRVKTDSTLTVTTGPMMSKLHICARCNGVFWDTRPFLPALADADAVPELKKFKEWHRRMEYERTQREGNEAAAALYRQYKVALKLGEHDPANIDVGNQDK